MIKRKCPGCAEKIERKFNFCPWCGYSIKGAKEEEDFGMLGRNDFTNTNQFTTTQQPENIPFGLGKMVNSLMKQLEKELSSIENQNGRMPKGFSVRIQSGIPIQKRPQEQKKPSQPLHYKNVSPEEQSRRQKLPKKDAQSKVKRLSDKIIYEVEAPGIQNKDDVVITKLEEGFEVKMYTKNACYTKIIPLQVEIEHFFLKKDTVVIELKE